MSFLRDGFSQASAPVYIARCLVLAYLTALSLGGVQGADPAQLLTSFLGPAEALYLAAGAVVSLAALVLFGVGRRLAALTLALIFFSASYLQLVQSGLLAGFWRDLALIGVLLLTSGVGFEGKKPNISDESEPDPLAHVQKIVSTPQMLPESPRSKVMTRFREDFDAVRQA